MTVLEILENNGIIVDDTEEIVQIDGFEKALVGITDDNRLVYSYQKMVEVMMDGGADKYDAMDYVDYNIMRCQGYISRHTIVVYEIDQ